MVLEVKGKVASLSPFLASMASLPLVSHFSAPSALLPYLPCLKRPKMPEEAACYVFASLCSASYVSTHLPFIQSSCCHCGSCTRAGGYSNASLVSERRRPSSLFHLSLPTVSSCRIPTCDPSPVALAGVSPSPALCHPPSAPRLCDEKILQRPAGPAPDPVPGLSFSPRPRDASSSSWASR